MTFPGPKLRRAAAGLVSDALRNAAKVGMPVDIRDGVQGRPTSYADGSWPTQGVDVVDPVTNARCAWAYIRRAYGPPEPDGKAG